MAFCAIRRSNQGSALDMLNPSCFTDLLVPEKRVRMYELLDREVQPSGLQVLSYGHHFQSDPHKIIHQCFDFLGCLTETDHDTALRTQSLVAGDPKYFEGLLIVGLRANPSIKPGNSFQVVVQDLRTVHPGVLGNRE